MSNLNVNFENLTEEEKAQLLVIVEKSQTKNDPIKFEIDKLYCLVGTKGNIIESFFYKDNDVDKALMSFGNAYHTKEQAETASKAMRRFNRILQFAILHDGYREFVKGEENFYVYYGYPYSKFSFGYVDVQENTTCVYMTKECAELLCEKLNSGEYTL